MSLRSVSGLSGFCHDNDSSSSSSLGSSSTSSSEAINLFLNDQVVSSTGLVDHVRGSWKDNAKGLEDIPKDWLDQIDGLEAAGVDVRSLAGKTDLDACFRRLEQLTEESKQLALLLPPELRETYLTIRNLQSEAATAKYREIGKQMKAITSRTSNKSLARKREISQRKAIKCINSLNCISLQSEVTLIIKVAKHFNILPMNVTEENKRQYTKDKAREMGDQLIAEEESMKKLRQSKKMKKKAKPRIEIPVLTPNIKKTKIPVQNIAKNIFNPTSTDRALSEHSRVSFRWQSKNPDDLRKICDVVGDHPIYRYEAMDDASVLQQRSFHYLPGVEQLLAFPEARERYAFQTERGYGIVAQLITRGQTHEGVIYFGVDSGQQVYHKYFEKLESVATIFSGVKFEDAVLSEDNEAEWQPIGKYSFNLKENDFLEVLFDDEEHRLVVYPIGME